LRKTLLALSFFVLIGGSALGGESLSQVVSRAEKALLRGRYKEAVPDLERALAALERGGGDDRLISELTYNLIVCYRKTGDTARALSAAEERIRRRPEDSAVLELLGKIYYVQGRYEKAAAAFEQLKRLVPSTPKLLRQIAQVQINRRSQEEAVKAVGELLKADRSEAALEVALEGYVTFFMEEEALKVIAELRRLKGDRPIYRYAAGFAHARLGHFAEAEKELRKVLDDPVYGDDARFELGVLLGKQKARLGEAASVLARLLERDPYYSRAYFQLSQIFFRQRRIEEAKKLREIHSVLQKSDAEFRKEREFTAAGLSVEAVIHRAQGYQRRRQYRKAEAVLRAEIGKRPGEPKLYEALGKLLFRVERYREAEKILRRAGASRAARHMVGLCLWRQGKVEEARRYFRNLADDPFLHRAARVTLAQIALEEYGDPKEALDLVEPLEERGEGGSAVRFTKARALFEKKEYTKAAEFFRELSKEEGETGSLARLYSAWCLVRTGKASDALKLLNEVRGSPRGTGRYFEVKAEILEALGDSKAPGYRMWEEKIKTAEKEGKLLRRELATLSWPEAAPKLLELADNAEFRRKKRLACNYALLAAEADPRLPAALRRLLECPLSDFVRLSVLVRLSKLEGGDEKVKAEIAGIRKKYGLSGSPP